MTQHERNKRECTRHINQMIRLHNQWVDDHKYLRRKDVDDSTCRHDDYIMMVSIADALAWYMRQRILQGTLTIDEARAHIARLTHRDDDLTCDQQDGTCDMLADMLGKFAK